MTVTKTSGGSTCKKVFPQILVCQVFRWPQIVFHNDIKSSETCQHPGAVKLQNSFISQAGTKCNNKWNDINYFELPKSNQLLTSDFLQDQAITKASERMTWTDRLGEKSFVSTHFTTSSLRKRKSG